MSKICIVSYYGSIESLELAYNELSKHFKVFDFPLFKYIHDINEKVENPYEIFKNFIIANNIDIVLWWFINIPTDEFINIKKETNVKYLFFNWDEPYNWPHCDIIKKMPYFDAVFVTCKETLKTYLENGTRYAFCLYPAFDSKKNFIIDNIDINDYNKYSCDISFCCTNLYEDLNQYPNQYIPRKKLIDDIYNGQSIFGYKFYIYGPASLGNLYPKSYKGFGKYDNLNKIFNYSKINLCTHVLNNKNGYLNERVILIGGSGGLLLVDYVDGIEDIFKLNEHIIIIDKHFYLQQIVSILDNYEKYVQVRKDLNYFCNTKFTYNNWANTILNIIKIL